MENSKKLSGRNIAIAATLIVLFGVAFVLVLRAYRQEGEKRSAVISESGEKDPNHVEIFVKLVSVDPIKGDTSARLEFIPHGDLTSGEGVSLTKDLKLFVNSATGKQEHVFEKGKRMNPVDVTINLYDGQVTDYPFDEHHAHLELSLTAQEKQEKAKAATTASPGNPAGEESGNEGAHQNQTEQVAKPEASPSSGAIPIAVDFFGSIHGLSIQATKSPDSSNTFVAIEMSFVRASTVKFFCIFVMFVMWGVAIMVLLLTLAVSLRGRKVELTMFTFMSALIFALITLRNAQPGSPPIGSYSDYLSFFWAEIIIALCLLTIIGVWLYRPPAK